MMLPNGLAMQATRQEPVQHVHLGHCQLGLRLNVKVDPTNADSLWTDWASPGLLSCSPVYSTVPYAPRSPLLCAAVTSATAARSAAAKMSILPSCTALTVQCKEAGGP